MHYATRSSIHSPYTHAAKIFSPTAFDLCSSAVRPVSMDELPIRPEDLSLGPAGPYGNPLLIERLAQRTGVPAECIVPTIGTSLGIHLAYSALFDPGDEVLIEEPTYDPMLHSARLLGASIRRFPRRPENAFAIDPDDVRRAITPRTRLIALCNLHNPTNSAVSVSTLRAIGEIANSVGAHVLVDEVYRECIWGAADQHALSLGPQFVVTTSLTKAYGLGTLRCGWILAEPELASRIRLMQDLFTGTAPHISEHISAVALGAISQLESRARRVLDANRASATEILSPSRGLEVTIPPYGTVIAPRLLSGSVEAFCELLRTKYEVGVVPGFHFEMPNYFRIGLGGDPALTREAFERLACAVEDFSTQS